MSAPVCFKMRTASSPENTSPLAMTGMDTASLTSQMVVQSEYNCEKIAVLTARRHYAWYLKGVPHASCYKEQIVRMETLEDVGGCP